MKDFIDICFIGDGSHATRIKQTLSDLSIKFNLVTFDRNKAISSQPEVINCQVIFITSPNDTHADYLADLNKIFNGYIYCEKPPFNEINKVDTFDEINHSKCFFGFNYRYSKICTFVSDMSNKYDLGKPINMNIHVSYPFAIKDMYANSWKSDISKSPLGVIENLGIHYIDLSVTLFGKINYIYINKDNVSNTGSAIDTASIFCEHENQTIAQIFISYSTLVKDEIYITFENGDIKYDGFKFKLYYPKNIFNNNGLAVIPPIVFEEEFDRDMLYEQSMLNCIEKFMSVVVNREKFEARLSADARMSTLAMFGIS